MNYTDVGLQLADFQCNVFGLRLMLFVFTVVLKFERSGRICFTIMRLLGSNNIASVRCTSSTTLSS
jgi:hypothetical protein